MTDPKMSMGPMPASMISSEMPAKGRPATIGKSETNAPPRIGVTATLGGSSMKNIQLILRY